MFVLHNKMTNVLTTYAIKGRPVYGIPSYLGQVDYFRPDSLGLEVAKKIREMFHGLFSLREDEIRDILGSPAFTSLHIHEEAAISSALDELGIVHAQTASPEQVMGFLRTIKPLSPPSVERSNAFGVIITGRLPTDNNLYRQIECLLSAAHISDSDLPAFLYHLRGIPDVEFPRCVQLSYTEMSGWMHAPNITKNFAASKNRSIEDILQKDAKQDPDTASEIAPEQLSPSTHLYVGGTQEKGIGSLVRWGVNFLHFERFDTYGADSKATILMGENLQRTRY